MILVPRVRKAMRRVSGAEILERSCGLLKGLNPSSCLLLIPLRIPNLDVPHSLRLLFCTSRYCGEGIPMGDTVVEAAAYSLVQRARSRCVSSHLRSDVDHLHTQREASSAAQIHHRDAIQTNYSNSDDSVSSPGRRAEAGVHSVDCVAVGKAGMLRDLLRAALAVLVLGRRVLGRTCWLWAETNRNGMELREEERRKMMMNPPHPALESAFAIERDPQTPSIPPILPFNPIFIVDQCSTLPLFPSCIVHRMNTTSEIAPFFSTTADPSLIRHAADILRQLRTSRTEVTDFRSALPAISALLACERYVQPFHSFVS